MKNKQESKKMEYQSPEIRKVVLKNKKRVLDTCKAANADTRGLGPCGNDLGAVCK